MDAQIFRRTLHLARLASDLRSTFVYLAHDLVRASGGEASVVSTTLEVRLEVRFPCPDEIPLGCLDLGALYKRCPSKGEVSLEAEGDEPGTWWLRSGRRSLRVPNLGPRDFPTGPLEMDDLSEGPAITVGDPPAAGSVEYDPDELLAAVRHARRVVSEDEARPHQRVVLLDPKGYVVATDGSRLHLAGGVPAVPGDPEDPGSLWRVPVEAVDVVLGVADKLKGLDEIRLESGRGVLRWRLRSGDVTAIASCKAGQGIFPPWRRVVPDVGEVAPVVLDGPELLAELLAELEALRRAGAGDVALVEAGGGSCRLTLFDGLVELWAGREDARVELPAEGLARSVAVHGYQVRDALRAAEDRVELRVADNGTVVLDLGSGRRMLAARVVTDKDEPKRLRRGAAGCAA